MISRLLSLTPGAALGLYIGRLLSELSSYFTASTPLGIAFILTFSSTLICAILFRKVSLEKSWPALFLLIYVFYPEADWQSAFFSGFLTAVIWVMVLTNGRDILHIPKPWLFAGLVASLFFFIYLLTLAPDILPADSGEFQVVATNLGVAHPPGFTLYTMLAHLMTLLPIGQTAAYQINLLSAVTSAITLALVYAGVYGLTKKHLASLIAAIALGTATTFWAQSTTANIRSLSALFTAVLFILLIIFYRDNTNPEGSRKNKNSDNILILFAFFLGLGLTHHASLIFMSVIFIIFILLIDPSILRAPLRWWRPALAFLLGLLPILYLAFRANSEARGASPALATLPGFLEHVLALGFRGDLFTYLEPALLIERLEIMINVLTFQFHPLLLLGMFLGIAVLFLWDWRLGFLIGGSFLIHTFITATYRAPQTVEYMLPAYVALALLLGIGAGKSISFLSLIRFEKLQAFFIPLILSTFLVAAIWQGTNNFPSYQRLHQDTTARDYAQPLLQNAPQNSVILSDWHWVTPLWYLQEVEGLRPDVSVRFVFPEGEPYAETWARRIDDELNRSRPVISTHFSPETFHTLPAHEPAGEAFLFRTEPRSEMPQDFSPMDGIIGNKIQLLGYQIQQDNIQIADELIVTIAWQPLSELGPSTSLFTHLVDSNNQIIAQQDVLPNTQREGITLTQFRLAPKLGAAPGDYSVLFGASEESILVNEAGEERTFIHTAALTANDYPQATNHPLNRRMTFDPDLQVVGFDWDQTLEGRPRLYLHWLTAEGYISEAIDETVDSLPIFIGPWGIPSIRWSSILNPTETYYVPLGQGIVWQGNQLSSNRALNPGQSLTLEQNFLSGQPVMRDLIVSTRLIGYEEDGFHWAWWDLDDAVPAIGAVPTLKWIENSEVRSPHFLTVNPEAPTGQQIGGAVNLYDAFTNRQLPILDERLNVEFGWIPLGSTIIDGS